MHTVGQMSESLALEESKDGNGIQLPKVHEHLDDVEINHRDRGITSDEAARLLELFGPNEIPVHERSVCAIFAQQFRGTMPYILEIWCVF
jgi:hypothetical protein